MQEDYSVVDAGGALETLVNQFSDPYACFRELIQNSIDATSQSIFIDFEFRPYEEKDLGIGIIRISDTGAGMNRHIIDTKLTRLFSSTKENDLTTIGKYGIGFASVFALKPKAVIVDTGRDGEYWRLIFREDRSFERIKLDYPVEGTELQIVRELSQEEFSASAKRARDAVVFWCRYASSEIYVDGDLVNEPFSFGSPYELKHEISGTKIVLEPNHSMAPKSGFYNQGLTLVEEPFPSPGVAFKMDSRYFAHTLTRDNVQKNEFYDQAIGILRNVISKEYVGHLCELLAKEPNAFLLESLGFIYYSNRVETDSFKIPIVSDVQGKKYSLDELMGLKKVYMVQEATPVAEALSKSGEDVFLQSSGLVKFFEATKSDIEILDASQRFGVLLPVEVDEKVESYWKDVCQLLKAVGSPYERFHLAEFSASVSRFSERVYLAHEGFEVPYELPAEDLGAWGQLKNTISGLFSRLKKRDTDLFVNLSHPMIQSQMSLMRSDYKVACYMLAKAICLDDGLSVSQENALLSLATSPEFGRN